MKRKEQLALLTPEQLAKYKRYRTFAILCGFGMIWTFPMLSWPTLWPILYEMNRHDTKLTMLQLTFGSFIPLMIAVAIFANLANHFQRKARQIRTGDVDEILKRNQWLS